VPVHPDSSPDIPPPTGAPGWPPPSSAAFLARASVLLAGATLLSRLLGLVREMLIARYYGASGQTDSFFYALIIPEILRTLIISGAVASVFIPIMTETQRSGRKNESRKLAGMMLSFVSILAIIVVASGEIIAPMLVNFSRFLSFAQEPLDLEQFRLTTELIRIFLPVVLFVGLWGLMGGILNALDNFHVPGLAPLAWNGAIIIILVLVGKYGDVRHVAWAFVIGHFIQMLVHLPALRQAGIYPVMVDWKHPMILKFLQLAPAAVLAYAAQAINAFIGQGIALTRLSESSASSLAYAFRIQQLPMAIFGVSVATALFPTLSRHAVSGSSKELMGSLASGLRMTALATLPAIVFFLILPVKVIRLLLERGAFTSGNTYDVALALYAYSWAILPMALTLLTARTFFSLKDTRTPAILGIFSVLVFYPTCLFLSSRFDFTGIAFSTAIVSWILLIVSVAILHHRHRDSASLLASIGFLSPVQMLIAALAEAAALIGYRMLWGEVHGLIQLIIMITGGIVIGGGIYLSLLRLMKNPDLDSTLRRFLKRN